MVTAGVYLICRTHPIFEAAPDIQHLAADPRARHAPRRRRDRARPVGHQARDRVLDDVPDRLHVRRRGDRRVRVRDVPPRHARVLQGAALPRRRARDPPPRRRAGHPQDGRPREVDAVHALDVPDRLARARGDPAVRRASGRRTRSSPPRSRTAARSAGCSTSAGCSARSSPGSTRFRLYFRVFHGEPSELVTAHTHGEHHGEGAALDARSRSACSRSARRSSASSRSRASGSRSRTGSSPSSPPLVEPTAAQDWLTSLSRGRARGRSASSSPGARSGAARARPRRLRAHRARAQALLRRALRRRRSRGRRSSSRCGCATASRRRSSRARSTRSPRAPCAARAASASVQSGLLRTYALAFTVAVAVLTLVFLVVR